jgi:transglutaminase-like putative cysteine protease/tetratricopeptide (TPR) repeat protein
MRKFLVPLILFVVVAGNAQTNSQVSRIQAREAEWKNYTLPKANFTRKMNSEKNFIYRIPTDWTPIGDLDFIGPNNANFKILVDKIPEGYPLDEYFGALLQAVKDMSGAAETVLSRKVELQDVEAREMLLQFTDAEGTSIRSTSWVTIRGPQALMFNLKVPATHSAEIEPFFKAIVQSIIFVSSDDNLSFEPLRSFVFKKPVNGPINELESIVTSLSETTTEREAAINRLAALYSATPDVAIDLLLDRRPLIRAGAAQAIARSKNSALTPFLWKLLDDPEPLVSEAAARSVAASTDVVPRLLERSMSGFRTEIFARVWPFVTREKRNEVLEIIFKEPAVKRSPPPVVNPSKSRVSVTVAELIPVQPGKPIPTPESTFALARDPNVQLGALMLLLSIPPDEYKLPLARLTASNYNPLIAVGLQVAYARSEVLPLAPLLKLVLSSDEQVSTLAALNLVLAATVADIPQIEALISKDGSRKALDEELKLAVKQIKFRNELAGKSEAETQQLITRALTDASLANFAWRFHCEVTASGCTPNTAGPKRDLAIKPFAENLFPKKVVHYTAIPHPRQAVQNFYETLHGLQLNTPRAQSNLLLMMGNIRQFLGREISAPLEAETLIEYTGIDPDSPIALGSWTAPNALDSTVLAKRHAIVLRVKDRTRFERLIEKFQRGAGGVPAVTTGVAIGTRAIAAAPAVLPFLAQAIATPRSPTKPAGTLLVHSFISDKEWNGLRLRTIEHTWLNGSWRLETASTHLAYIGDTVILAPDIATIRDLLTNAAGTERQFLADNPEFKQAIDSGGDIVYFSDLKAVFASTGGTNGKPLSKIDERGALKFSSSAWENRHQLAFDESDWSRSFISFQPKELTAPRDLLPASTIVYYLMKLDLPLLSSSESIPALLSQSETDGLKNALALDLKNDVLPELGPECGIVALDLPGPDFEGGTWAAFCKLKSEKLADALKAGKLFRNVGPVPHVAEVKIDSTSYFFAVRNGFLVVSNALKGIAALGHNTNLAGTRDYSRAVEKAPNSIVAFGGYNLEAAITAAGRPEAENPAAQFAEIIISVASAFHSQNFYATATAGSVDAHSSVAMDREGRYAVADFSYLPTNAQITYAVIEPRGVQITDQSRVSNLVLRVKAKAPGPIDHIRDDIKTAEQVVEQKSTTELLVTVAARRPGAEKTIELPVKDAELAQFLKPTAEFPSDKKEVIDRAREIAGSDRDAWSVARKLGEWTHKNLQWKMVQRADAVQTLATREADCSEFSALFIAMARSLGLPARMVSGIAYTGSAFGGHAWVEVWVGRWIELDPTWGTDFVDATHIRNATNALIWTAALNQIELEVLETKRTTAEFQKTPRALAEHLVRSILARDQSDIEASLDIAVLTDHHMGAGAWAGLSEKEREQMWSAYRRLLNETLSYSNSEFGQVRLRLIHVEEKGDTAEAICIWEPIEVLLKVRLLRRNDVWHLVDFVQADNGYAVFTETMRATISAIEKVRKGEAPPPTVISDFARLLTLVDDESEQAVPVANELLKSKPKDQGLRFMKALALLQSEKPEEGVSLLTELSNENHVPAIFRLASEFADSEEEADQKKSLELYERYTKLEPYDPRGFREVGHAHDPAKTPAEAEAAYRKALALDAGEPYNYINLITLYLKTNRLAEVRPLLVASDKQIAADDDLFGELVQQLVFIDELKRAEQLAANEPARMKTSMRANLDLGHGMVGEARYVEAERLFNTAAQIDPKSTSPHIALAGLYRKQSRWQAALKAADHAIALDPKESEAYYQRACALARMRKLKEAMTALTKSIELDEEQTMYIGEEEDLKPLASLPEFKKLLPPPEKPQP